MGLFDPVAQLLGVGGDGGAGDTLRRALAEFSALKSPTADDLKAIMQKYVVAGQLSPQLAQTVLANPSKFQDLTIDQTGRGAALKSLAGLDEVASHGGLDDQSRLAVQEATDTFNSADRGSREAIVENAAHRGVRDSGLDLAAQLQSQQAAATNGHRQAMQAAADARARALAALTASGQLGTTVQAQDNDIAAKRAAAVDEINKFNVANQNTVAGQNTDRVNRAGEVNLSNKQNVADQNTTTTNTNAVRNAGLPQQVFANKMAIAAGKSGIYSGIADQEQNQAARKDAFTGSIIGTGGDILTGYLKPKKGA